jgi:hypothetical protein
MQPNNSTNCDLKFIQEYNQIMQKPTTIFIKTEWEKTGDRFKKLSMYDDSYISIIRIDKGN